MVLRGYLTINLVIFYITAWTAWYTNWPVAFPDLNEIDPIILSLQCLKFFLHFLQNLNFRIMRLDIAVVFLLQPVGLVKSGIFHFNACVICVQRFAVRLVRVISAVFQSIICVCIQVILFSVCFFFLN